MVLDKILVHSLFGSHLYGTNTPSSDKDYKGIFLPHPREMILQRAHHTSINRSTKLNYGGKNSSEDIDSEFFTLQSFIRLCAEGQTVALDLLFTPTQFILAGSTEWEYIQKHRHQLIHKGTAAFYGYARQQAAKYGIKGSRVGAMRQVLHGLQQFDPMAKMTDLPFEELKQSIGTSEHIDWVMINGPAGKEELHLMVCNRKIPIHARIKYATEVFQKIFNEYGKRALAAEQNENVDSKALSHAVRVCHEAKELLLTGHITFPRPEADFLLKIKLGELKFKEVSPLLEQGLEELEACKLKSKLPEQINTTAWEDWVFKSYLSHAKRHII